MTFADWFVIVVGSFGFIGYIPQIVTMARTRNIGGLNFWWIFFGEIGFCVWLWYGIHIGNKSLIITNIIGVTLQSTVLALYLKVWFNGPGK